MGKKAKKVVDEEVEESLDDNVDDEEETAEEAAPAVKPRKEKAKKATSDESEELEAEKEPSKDAPKDGEIFEEKSAVAKQFEATEQPKEEITEERTYTVPLNKAFSSPPKYRAKKAILMIRAFFKRHMKAQELVILPEVNETVWANGITNPPRRLKIRATKSIEGTVTLYLAA